MGKRDDEHRQAVGDGKEPPIRHEEEQFKRCPVPECNRWVGKDNKMGLCRDCERMIHAFIFASQNGIIQIKMPVPAPQQKTKKEIVTGSGLILPSSVKFDQTKIRQENQP